MNTPKNVLITGAARRIGAACAKLLHEQGHNVIVHYHSSEQAAQDLIYPLNRLRENSAICLSADLRNITELDQLASAAETHWGGIDILINNASLFHPQSIADTTEQSWDAFLDSNLKAPFFLAKALANTLKTRQGSIINIIDIHSERGLPNYPVYSISKAGLEAMTRILAKELAPEIRVNGISPGAILWPAEGNTDAEQQDILNGIALQRLGEPSDIAKAVLFLCKDADYMTGQILKVDGGRTLFY